MSDGTLVRGAHTLEFGKNTVPSIFTRSDISNSLADEHRREGGAFK